MMGERRALLDPEMYKISEEDSQDEEVLSSGNGHKPEGGVNGNPAGAGSSSQWRPRGSGYDSSAWLSEQGDDCEEVLSFPGNHVSSSFCPSEFRIGHGVHHQHLKQRSTAMRSGMRDYDDNENSLDWPDTSTNSDSYESDREGKKLAKEFQSAKIEERPQSKTYFGDHLANHQPPLESNTVTEASACVLPRTFPAKFGRRPKPKSRTHERDLSTSGSDYSEHEQTQCENSGSSTTGSSSDECTDCVHSSVTRRYHSHSHSRPRRTSSSEVEEYDSSYSDSSSEQNPMDYYDEEDNTGYSDSDNEWTEYFENPNKLLNQRDVELSTTEDGELFLIEYSEEEQDQRDSFSTATSRSSNVDRESFCRNSSHLDLTSTHLPSAVSAASDIVGPKEGPSKHDQSKKGATGAASEEKSQKSKKGKISRLLKRKRDPIPSPMTNSIQENGDASMIASMSSSHLPTTSSLAGSSKSDSNTAPEKVFRFKDEHGGETRTVYVDVPQSVPNGNLLGRRATLIESFLGIIPGHFSSPPTAQTVEVSQHERIMVAGFVPDGIGSKYRRIKIGDWLQSVDDIPVNHENVDQVLTSRLQYGKRRTTVDTEYLRLKLILKRVAGCMVSLPSSTENLGCHSSSTHTGCNSSRTYITQPWLSTVTPQVRSNVAILYISNGSTNKSNEPSSQESSGSSLAKSKDVVYSWPSSSESKMVRALAASQGLFSTVYRLLWDVAGSHPTLSRVVVDDCEMDVTYSSDDQGESLLLIGVATCLSTFTMHHNMTPLKNETSGKSKGTTEAASTEATGDAAGVDAKKREKKIRWREPQSGGVTVSTRVLSRLEGLIKFQFGTYARAFDQDNEEKLDRILTNSLAALNDLSEDFLFLQVPGNFIRLPNFVRSGIDDVMYSFETSDAMNWDSINRRLSKPRSRLRSRDAPVPDNFYCHGSCLIYKSRIIASHLENDLTSAFYGWFRTQMGLWQAGSKDNLVNDRKPPSRLAIWQQTNLHKKTIVPVTETNLEVPNSSLHGIEEGDFSGTGVHLESDNSQTRIQSSFVRCFSGLVGMGHFNLGFVLEEMTQPRGNRCTQPSIDWLRRAMATLCRLDHSAISHGYESTIESRNGKEDFVELAGSSTSTYTSANQQRPDKGSTSSNSKPSTSSLVRLPTVATSILKNTDPTLTASNLSSSSSSSSQHMQSSQYNNPTVNSSASNTSISSSSSIGAGVASRSSFYSVDESPSSSSFNARVGEQGSGYGSDDCADALDLDDTTTGTGSDNSSFKWYERAANELNESTPVSDKDIKHIRVTRGSVLIDYLQVEFGRGVLLTYKDNHDGWAAAVRHNFRQTVVIIHQILHKAASARQRLEERGKDRKWVSLALAPISEHGIMFNCQLTDHRDLHKKKTRKRNVNYWVVGRIYPDEREIYVCYEDGHLSQNLVEIAYKVALNVFS